MSCKIKNPSGIDLSSLGPHVQGMYDYFDQKIGFQKPPVMFFDSDPSNQSKVLGKTAYYDPQSLEVHVFVDGRHPKDMLRSIAHELIHHQQNLEGRLDVGGYMGEGYYLKNEEMKKLEQEAMLKGNALMREYEDNLKLEEKNKMSLKEWKNNELNKQLLKKFGILKEAAKPDYIDLDKDGDKEESMKKAAEDAKKAKGEEKEDLDESSCGSHRKDEQKIEEGDGFPEGMILDTALPRKWMAERFGLSPKQHDTISKLRLMDLDKEHLEAMASMFKEMAQSDGVNIMGPDKQKYAVNVTPGQLSLYQKASQMAQRVDPNRPLPPMSEEVELQEMDRSEEMFYYLKSKMPDASNEEIMDAVNAYTKDTYAPRKASPPMGSPPKNEGLQEALKKIAKAKNIVLKSSGKRIK